jgi:hypothetical protein
MIGSVISLDLDSLHYFEIAISRINNARLMLLLCVVRVNVTLHVATVRQRTVLFGYELQLASDYICVARFSIAAGYRMKIRGSEFIINHHSAGTVGVYKTEREARQGMEDCRRDDLTLKAAKVLLEKAVNSLMRAHHIEREAAHGWIREAAD